MSPKDKLRGRQNGCLFHKKLLNSLLSENRICGGWPHKCTAGKSFLAICRQHILDFALVNWQLTDAVIRIVGNGRYRERRLLRREHGSRLVRKVCLCFGNRCRLHTFHCWARLGRDLEAFHGCLAGLTSERQRSDKSTRESI